LAIKYLAGERLQGTAAERAAMTTATGIWTPIGTAAPTINTTTGLITSTTNQSTLGNDRLYIDMGFTLGDTWIAHYDYTGTSSGGANTRPLGFTDTTVGMAETSGDDIHHYMDTNVNFGKKESGTISQSYIGFTFVQNTTYYHVIERTSDTSTTIRVYSSNANRTADTDKNGSLGNDLTRSINAGSITGLKYAMSSKNDATGGTGASHTYTIANLKVWNNETDNTPSGTPDFVASATYTYPNLSNGTIFEESDTGKHYMWNGTATWNEVT